MLLSDLIADLRLDLSDPRDAHLRHAYVQTAHAAQGRRDAILGS